MSTLQERHQIASAGVHDSADGFATRVVLQPIAAPSILGLAGFAGATFIVASNLAGWWGTSQSPLALAPFDRRGSGSASLRGSRLLVPSVSDQGGVELEIGKPRRIHRVEPVKDPVPKRSAPPAPAPRRAPAKLPAK